MKQQKISIWSWVIYLLLAVVWGSSFKLMKESLHYFRFDEIASFRVLIAGIALLPFALRGWKSFNKNKIKYAVMMGLFGSSIPAFLFPAAQQHIPSGVAGVLNSLTPIFVLLLGILFFKAGYTKTKVLGIITGFAGTIGLILFTHSSDGTTQAEYALLIVIGTVMYGLSNQILQRWLHDENPVTITAIAFMMVAPLAAAYLVTTPVLEVFKTNPDAWKGFSYIATLALCGTALALPLYNYLAQQTGVLFASTLTFVMPVVSLAWGLRDGEPLGMQHIICMMVILFGVYLVRKK